MNNFDYKTPSLEEIQLIERRAHAMRAEYMRSIFVSFGARIRGLFQGNGASAKQAA